MKWNSPKLVRVLVSGLVIYVAFAAWNWWAERYTRFPVHRLPDIALFRGWKLERTRSDIAAIRNALEAFRAHYGHLPFNSPRRDYQGSITLGHDLHGVLTNLDRTNPDQIVFWDVPAGEQRDGWGRLYHYHFDHDGDGQVNTGNRIVAGDYFVWSDGPDQINQEGAGDDLH